jgi:hypothetical protein
MITICLPPHHHTNKPQQQQLFTETIIPQLLLSSPPHNNNNIIYHYETLRNIYTDYGEYSGLFYRDWNNPTMKRHWREQQRSPYAITLTGFEKPNKYKNLTPLEWATQIWFPIQAPFSEVIQPRARYVRYLIITNSSSIPPFAGLVVEAWPSKQHVENVFLALGVSNNYDIFTFFRNTFSMLYSVHHFTNLFSLQQWTMGEYIM